MKTDVELLEAAAKAAGMEGLMFWPGALDAGEPYAYASCAKGVYWRPLGDDGDAFRLAMKLALDLCVSPDYRLCAWSAVSSDWVEESPGSDPCAAMRRAIVRAAAMAG